MQVVRAPERLVLGALEQPRAAVQVRRRVRRVGQRPGRHRRLLRVEEIGVAEMRQVLAGVAAGVLPAAVHVDKTIRLEDADAPVALAGVAAAMEIVEQLVRRRREQRPLAHPHRRGCHALAVERRLDAVDARRLHRGKVRFEVAFARAPCGEVRQRLEVALRHGLAAGHHAVASVRGRACRLDDRAFRIGRRQRHLIHLHQQRIGGEPDGDRGDLLRRFGGEGAGRRERRGREDREDRRRRGGGDDGATGRGRPACGGDRGHGIDHRGWGHKGWRVETTGGGAPARTHRRRRSSPEPAFRIPGRHQFQAMFFGHFTPELGHLPELFGYLLLMTLFTTLTLLIVGSCL